jgi:hypothetical protein
MFIPKVMNSYYNKNAAIVILSEFMYSEVVGWLKPKIRHLLIDYMNIKKGTEEFGIRDLSDYSYLITPTFKALEGTLLEIGRELNFDLNKYQFRIGVIFSDENLEKYYNDVLDKIKHLTEEKRVDIKQWLDNARRILKSLRHTPAHYEGEPKENWTKAFLSGDLIITTINEMCHTLIENNLFPSIVAEKIKEAEEEQRRIIAIRKSQTERP